MKIGKNIVLLSITIIALISLVAIATYSYFTASTNITNKITTNVKMPMRPTFTVSGGGELTLAINYNITLKENVYNGSWINDKNYKEVAKNLVVTLSGESGTTCTYNINYKDTSSNGNYVYAPTGPSTDFTFVLRYNGEGIINFANYKNISQTSAGTPKITALFGSADPFNKAKPTITIPAGTTSVTDTWTFILLFYNVNQDQSALAGKTFKGELYVDDVVCT